MSTSTLNSPRPSLLAATIFAVVGAIPCHALVIFNKTNDSTDITSDPNNGSPWESVARISDNGNTKGSAVYLGNRYLLTANHVDPSNTRTVQFSPEGPNFDIEADSQQQVASGLDLKVFRIKSDPGILGVNLYGGTNELNKNTTIVGWGRGRDSSVSSPGDTTQQWGNQSTTAKRWGDNVITDTLTRTYNSGYEYEGIEYTLGNNQTDTEAGFATWDSGGAMFIQDSSNYYLAGINAIVQTNGSSNFGSRGSNESGDINFGPRISTYKSDIEAIVPEPSTTAIAIGLAALGAVATFRRRPWESGR